MNGKVRLYVYGITVEAWTARYGVQPFSYPCYQCGRMCTTTIPFVQGTLRGLQAPPCECGHPYPPYAMVRDSAYGDLFTGTEVPTKPKQGGKVIPWRKRNE